MRLAPPDLLHRRLTRLRQALVSADLDALIVTSLPHISYLTNFFGSAAVAIVTSEGIQLLSDGRYESVIRARAGEYPVLAPALVPQALSYEEALINQLRELAARRVGLEESHITLRRYRSIEAARQTGRLPELVATEGLVETLRAEKDVWEIAVLREAAARLSECAKRILPKRLAGQTEREVAFSIDVELRRAGFDRPAFETIVAGGEHAALPHHRASDRRIVAGDLVVLDFGGVLDGYAVDLTRTMPVERTGHRERAVLEAVTGAQAAALAEVEPGVAPERVDASAREWLARAGLAEAFTHSTGHGLGLEVHERPRIGPARSSGPEPPLTPGMVCTIEPGVYFPGWGGVRIEDDVLVTTMGAERLTDVPALL